MWKLRQLDDRERFISLKQKKFQDKRDEALHIRGKLLRDAKITSDSETKRQEQWRIADKHLNESVVEAAFTRVTFIDELIPTLMVLYSESRVYRTVRQSEAGKGEKPPIGHYRNCTAVPD
jgi:hypothetical protein